MTECPLAVCEHTDFWSRLARDGKWHTTRAVADRQNLLRLPQNVGGIVSMLKTLTCSAHLRKPRLGHLFGTLRRAAPFSQSSNPESGSCTQRRPQAHSRSAMTLSISFAFNPIPICAIEILNIG